MEKIKRLLVNAWKFIWESNSPWSWVANIIIAFLLIKFVVYPVMGLALGTGFPVVAVVSGSMEHEGGFDSWWNSSCPGHTVQNELYEKYNIEKHDFDSFRFRNGFNKGDIMVLSGAENIEVGDTIVFVVQHRNDPVIHRIVNVENGKYTTKGDANCGSAEFETGITDDRILGKAVFRIPFLGWIKISSMNMIGLLRGG